MEDRWRSGLTSATPNLNRKPLCDPGVTSETGRLWSYA